MEIERFERLDSTNLKAKELAARGAGAWTVVLAREQEAGYGRKGAEWFSPRGGLYFSTILPNSSIKDLQLLTILASFAVAGAIKELFDLEPLIKLPNDVLLNGRKVCGILTENVVGKGVKSSVIGVGLNTNTELFGEFDRIATSIRKETGEKVDDEKLLHLILERIKGQLESIKK